MSGEAINNSWSFPGPRYALVSAANILRRDSKVVKKLYDVEIVSGKVYVAGAQSGLHRARRYVRRQRFVWSALWRLLAVFSMSWAKPS